MLCTHSTLREHPYDFGGKLSTSTGRASAACVDTGNDRGDGDRLAARLAERVARSDHRALGEAGRWRLQLTALSLYTTSPAAVGC